MFNYLNTIFMIFIQFFLKGKFNEENIDLYLIFLSITIDLNKQINKNVKSKNEIIKNIEYLLYDNILIISYLCLKNEKKEYKNIFDNIIEYSKSKNEIFFSKIKLF